MAYPIKTNSSEIAIYDYVWLWEMTHQYGRLAFGNLEQYNYEN